METFLGASPGFYYCGHPGDCHPCRCVHSRVSLHYFRAFSLIYFCIQRMLAKHLAYHLVTIMCSITDISIFLSAHEFLRG